MQIAWEIGFVGNQHNDIASFMFFLGVYISLFLGLAY